MNCSTNLAFEVATSRVVISKMHALRIEGNHAVHGNRDGAEPLRCGS